MSPSPARDGLAAAICRAEFGSTLDEFDHRPKLVVDQDQAVLWCCPDAQRMLAAPMPLYLGEGKLIVTDEESSAEFADFLNSVGSEIERKLIRGKASRHWAVVCAWKPPAWDRAVCIVCSPSLPLRDIVESGLARELKLTRAETRVLNEFAELNSPKQIARNLDVSLSTVRSHLKTIHAKAAVTSSAQLLRLTHTFCSG